MRVGAGAGGRLVAQAVAGGGLHHAHPSARPLQMASTPTQKKNTPAFPPHSQAPHFTAGPARWQAPNPTRSRSSHHINVSRPVGLCGVYGAAAERVGQRRVVVPGPDGRLGQRHPHSATLCGDHTPRPCSPSLRCRVGCMVGSSCAHEGRGRKGTGWRWMAVRGLLLEAGGGRARGLHKCREGGQRPVRKRGCVPPGDTLPGPDPTCSKPSTSLTTPAHAKMLMWIE